MILVLCNPSDTVAQQVHQKLIAQGAPAHLVMAADLMFAPYWSHTLSAKGKVATEIRLQHGLVIESRKVQAVYNRLSHFEAIQFLNDTDRAYAETELLALYASFLKSMEHALPAPLQLWQLNPEGLSDLQVQAAAIAAGLSVPDTHFTTSPRWMQTGGMIPMSPLRKTRDAPYRKSPHLIWEDRPVRQIAATTAITRITVAGGQVLGQYPEDSRQSLLRLADALGSIHLDAFIGETEQRVRVLYRLDAAPQQAGPDALAAITKRLLQKTLQPA